MQRLNQRLITDGTTMLIGWNDRKQYGGRGVAGTWGAGWGVEHVFLILFVLVFIQVGVYFKSDLSSAQENKGDHICYV